LGHQIREFQTRNEGIQVKLRLKDVPCAAAGAASLPSHAPPYRRDPLQRKGMQKQKADPDWIGLGLDLWVMLEEASNGGVDETRTRDLLRDRQAF
jgi:hypothetical protein